ncbi:MAG: tRNA (adenosine(37)-N6)-dimethylallyltransferase MiaA [Candidatus Eisenbacteria bacterium]|nr:tRNA (adenosine(37)-N6)-dimethylallyltransferase MiaA [Candidatus Eisenbacteria bacterium]
MTGTPRDRRRTVMAIVGPTAVGKTGVAVPVARELRGEIVSADSRQIYRGLDIGTAKPDAAETAAAPHHLIDIAEPSERFDAARFASLAEHAIEDVFGRDLTPIVVGGTGFYVTSLFEGLFEGPGRDKAIRSRLEEDAARLGPRALHERLAAVDPDAADRLHPNDAVRVVRALEVHESTGRTLSAWQREGRREPRYRPWYVLLTMDRELLYRRIELRVDRMVEAGLLEEVDRLLASGRLAEDMPAANALGYRELIPVVRGERALEEAVEEIKRNTRRFAKRQVTWFSRTPAELTIDMGKKEPEEAAHGLLEAWRRAAGRER